jgi:hypothetical protein
MQELLLNINLFLELNVTYQRKRVLTDEAFSPAEFVQVLVKRPTLFPFKRVSLLYALLSMKTELWLPKPKLTARRMRAEQRARQKRALFEKEHDYDDDDEIAVSNASGQRSKRSRA